MQLNRRGFLKSCLLLAAAPAIVRADSLMRIIPRDAALLVVDAINDDAAMLQTIIDRAGAGGTIIFPSGVYNLSRPLKFKANNTEVYGGNAHLIVTGNHPAMELSCSGSHFEKLNFSSAVPAPTAPFIRIA